MQSATNKGETLQKTLHFIVISVLLFIVENIIIVDCLLASSHSIGLKSSIIRSEIFLKQRKLVQNKNCKNGNNHSLHWVWVELSFFFVEDRGCWGLLCRCSVFILLVCWFLGLNVCRWHYRVLYKVPGPKGHPILGVLPMYLSRMKTGGPGAVLDLTVEIMEQYGEIHR